MLSILKCASCLGFPFKRQRLTGNIFFQFSFDYILLTRVSLDPTTPKSKIKEWKRATSDTTHVWRLLYSQLLRDGIDLDVHQQKNGSKCSTYEVLFSHEEKEKIMTFVGKYLKIESYYVK